MATVLWLDEVDAGNPAVAGGKGAKLGQMLRAGLPVPPGFVVTTDAYRAHLDAGHLGERIAQRVAALPAEDAQGAEAAAADVSRWILAVPLPPAVEQAVRAAYARLTARVSGAVAVRSSATAEDLAAASFAGQQETFLGLRGADDVLASIRSCWASLWAPRAMLYRAALGYDHAGLALAVVVQAMADAEVAGVLFTCDPVGGATDRFVVNASYGLGEAVVAGLVTPDTFWLTREGGLVRRALGSKERRVVLGDGQTREEDVAPSDRARFCLDRRSLVALAGLGRRVQEHFGSPQDLEWALADGRLSLLQARPVTAVGSPEAGGAPTRRLGRMERVFLDQLADRLPEPLTPLDLSVSVPLLYGGLFGLLADFGLRVPPADQALVELPDGRFVIRPRLPSPRAAMLWRLPATVFRAARSHPMALWAAVEHDLRGGLARLADAPIDTLDAVSLVGRVGDLQALLAAILPRRFRALLPGLIHEAMTRFWVGLAVGRRAAPSVVRQLYLDLPYRTALMNQALVRLAAVATASGKDSAPFAEALRVFLADWGDRPARGMEPAPSLPTWREDPHSVLALVDALQNEAPAHGGGHPEADDPASLAAARARVGRRLGRPAARYFLTSLERARALILAREDSLFALEGAIACLRRVVLELGDRLVTDGVIATRDDVFYLTTSELPAVARGTVDVRGCIERRRRAFGQVVAAFERGGNWLVASGTLPPPEDHRARSPAGDRLTGLPASRGSATGPVRVIRGPDDFGRLCPGDVLVCRATSPTWTPLFRLAAALVTDVGSPLSHAAIVAREYNIPAVVAAAGATSMLSDGVIVTVDGDAGLVSVARGSSRRNDAG